MTKLLTTFTIAAVLSASAFAVSAQDHTMPEPGEMMQHDDAMHSDMMSMMQMMVEMKPMMEACSEMMASMMEKMSDDMMPMDELDG